MRIGVFAAGVALSVFPFAAHAQQAGTGQAAAQAESDQPDQADDGAVDVGQMIVVQAQREPGMVIGDIPPDQQLDPADIRAYGVSSVSDLLDALAPQTQSASGGRPVVLLNGRRISSFREIRDLPSEAILRVDILPEEVALKYGYSADQRVVNFVLREHFRSVSVELTDRIATGGGRTNPEIEFGLVTINPNGRFNLNLEYEQSSKLLESERDILAEPSDDPFDLTGNITAADGGELDPALSAAAGAPVTIAGVPASAANGAPTLGDFAATANRANVTDLAPYRTLLPENHEFEANAVFARALGDDIQATINGSLEYSDSTADLGLPAIGVMLPAGNPFSPFADDVVVNRYAAGAPLQQSSKSITSHAGMTLDGSVDTNWRWTVTGNYDRVDSKSFTDIGVDASPLEAALAANDPAVNPFGPLAPPLVVPAASNTATSTSTTAGADALLHGNLIDLPAGGVSTSLKIGGQANDFSSRSLRNGIARAGDISRDIVNARLNLDLPIASKREDVLGWAGNVSADINVAVDHLSDFGTLKTFDYGLNWRPFDALRARVSLTDQDDAPSANQLGDPLVSTPNSRTFDYVRGETVDVTRISGGNPGLDAASRHRFKAGFNLRPFEETDFNLRADYISTRTDDRIASFPAVTAAIEAAFPDRFVRDASGQLVSVDTRPINFEKTENKRIRWGFNLSLPIKTRLQKELEAYRNGTGPDPRADGRRDRADGEQPEQAQRQGGERRTSGDRAQRGERAERGSGGRRRDGRGFGRRGERGGRLQFSLYHTWHLEDRVTIRPGLPVLDLLDGDVTGGSGGQPRHEVELRTGYYNSGLGARLSADWQSATDVHAGNTGAPETLHFSSLAKFNLRLFADIGAQRDFVRKHGWARGMRISLSADNLFDSRQHVTDSAGATPISYQPDYLDPQGRTIRISIRKLFS